MAIHKLSETKITRAKAKSSEYLLNDGDGLNLAIKPNGAKVWILRYTSPITKVKRKAGLGSYPSVSLEFARIKAKEYQELIKKGIDPINQRQEAKAKASDDELFINAVDKWIKDTKATNTLKTQKNIKSLFINDIAPHLKSKSIKEIKHPEIAKALKVKYDKAPAMAEKLYRYCNELFQWACTNGLCDVNIILNIHKKSILKPRTTMHHKTISDLQELEKLVQAIYGLGTNHTKANALKFAIFIPLRATNLTELEWDNINFSERTLTISRAKMKVKDPNLSDFTLPLSDEVISILTNQRQCTNAKKYVFSSNRHATHIHQATLNQTLKDLGFDIRLHGFRAMFRSLANTYEKEHNVSFEARERILDHITENATQRAYTHKSDYLSQMKILLEWWEKFILNLKTKKIKK